MAFVIASASLKTDTFGVNKELSDDGSVLPTEEKIEVMIKIKTMPTGTLMYIDYYKSVTLQIAGHYGSLFSTLLYS